MVVATNFDPPTEGIRHQEANVRAVIRSKDLGVGTLFICESRCSWKGNNGDGFSLEYPHIQIHAVSRDPKVCHKPCLYLIVEQDLMQGTDNGNNGTASDEEENDQTSPTTEVKFIPELVDDGLNAMYAAMSDCQALHPDPDMSNSEDEEDEYDIDQAEQEHGVDNEPMEGQFEDAD